MKKLSFFLLVCTVTLLFLVGCGEQPGSSVSSSPEKEETVVYENLELGIRFELPAVFQDHLKVDETTEEMGGEPVNVLYILYEDGEESAIIYRIEEMSSELWAKMQAEEGPKGMELGQRDGRAVVYYPPQSNPFEAGTDAHEAMQNLPEESSVLLDSFSFIE